MDTKYLEYCEANVDELTKIWQELKEPEVYRYNKVPVFDLIQLLDIFEKYNFIGFNFTKFSQDGRWYFGVSNTAIFEGAISKEECILKVILKLRRSGVEQNA